MPPHRSGRSTTCPPACAGRDPAPLHPLARSSRPPDPCARITRGRARMGPFWVFGLGARFSGSVLGSRARCSVFRHGAPNRGMGTRTICSGRTSPRRTLPARGPRDGIEEKGSGSLTHYRGFRTLARPDRVVLRWRGTPESPEGQPKGHSGVLIYCGRCGARADIQAGQRPSKRWSLSFWPSTDRARDRPGPRVRQMRIRRRKPKPA